jgi:hypothetical protein
MATAAIMAKTEPAIISTPSIGVTAMSVESWWFDFSSCMLFAIYLKVEER